MASISDLGNCNYLPLDCPALVAVGWLSTDDFVRGRVPLDFFCKLKALCVEPWQPVAAAGRYACELCQFDAPSFSDNLFIPHQGQIFIAPVAITHYIAAHHYLPPEVFIVAVMECPPTHSMAYKKALLANGGRSLVKPVVVTA